MAQAQRNDESIVQRPTARALAEADGVALNGYQPGGPVGQMHADLAARLAGDVAGPTIAPDERIVRVLSVAGGYLALAAAYAGIVLLFLR